MAFLPSSLIYAKRIPGKGLGVFAKVDIAAGTEIERVPVIVLPANEARQLPGGGVIGNYAFTWSKGQVAIALGFGSLYNHAVKPNATCADPAPRTKVFVARTRIHANEEITINYHGEPGVRADVGFPMR
ncbi:MAG: SET domain-containing protein-lysine N-methyltransferase [Myxococcales bacterium]|nr:SET domain-containing protein-lysine N-methyltransferase [Myxococcales bacterium]MDD9964770.1 SET domain-containing protein-lysine N-methyltransferase [Myxococcales bacterium]